MDMHPKQYAGQRLASGGEHMPYHVLLVPIDAACRLIGVGRTKIYQLIAERHLTLVKIGAKSLITVESLQHFVESLQSTRTLLDR
ncbi:helix-turn-helix domain-containing protein [Falsiroseomonas sp. E2-1-a4]|uniref:helix-turn-helix domain-containing protein n=1 Tax=Falsiroseomonas sp. E2-1-a4 TaxID=3239299 RepID=UPI003F59546A